MFTTQQRETIKNAKDAVADLRTVFETIVDPDDEGDVDAEALRDLEIVFEGFEVNDADEDDLKAGWNAIGQLRSTLLGYFGHKVPSGAKDDFRALVRFYEYVVFGC